MGQHLHLPPVGPVCGKRRYYTHGEAEARLSELKARERAAGRGGTARWPRVYWCNRCRALHLGHSSLWAARAESRDLVAAI